MKDVSKYRFSYRSAIWLMAILMTVLMAVLLADLSGYAELWS